MPTGENDLLGHTSGFDTAAKVLSQGLSQVLSPCQLATFLTSLTMLAILLCVLYLNLRSSCIRSRPQSLSPCGIRSPVAHVSTGLPPRIPTRMPTGIPRSRGSFFGGLSCGDTVKEACHELETVSLFQPGMPTRNARGSSKSPAQLVLTL